MTLVLGINQQHNKEHLNALTQDVKEETLENIAHEGKNTDTDDQNTSKKPDTEGGRIGRDLPFEFGKRSLTEESEVWDHNAWDNVEWGEEQVQQAEEKTKNNSSILFLILTKSCTTKIQHVIGIFSIKTTKKTSSRIESGYRLNFQFYMHLPGRTLIPSQSLRSAVGQVTHFSQY